MHKIISLEGHSGVGKTTIAKGLETDKFKRVGEFFHYLLPDEVIPTLEPRNNEELKHMRKMLFDLMLRREKNMMEHLGNGNNIILERTPLTFIYTELARTQKGYLTDIRGLCEDLYLIYSSQCSNLDEYIFLNASNELSVKRIMNRNGKETLGFFADLKTLEITKNFLDMFKTEYLIESQKFDISNETQSLGNIIATIEHHLNKTISFQSKLPDGIVKLCNDVVHGKDLLKELHIK